MPEAALLAEGLSAFDRVGFEPTTPLFDDKDVDVDVRRAALTLGREVLVLGLSCPSSSDTLAAFEAAETTDRRGGVADPDVGVPVALRRVLAVGLESVEDVLDVEVAVGLVNVEGRVAVVVDRIKGLRALSSFFSILAHSVRTT